MYNGILLTVIGYHWLITLHIWKILGNITPQGWNYLGVYEVVWARSCMHTLKSHLHCKSKGSICKIKGGQIQMRMYALS